MRYYLFFKPEATTGPEMMAETHENFATLSAHCGEYDALELSTGWVVARARLKHEMALDAIEAAGWIVWPHLADHAATLEDHHHLGIVPEHAAIETGDSTITAARKLYEAVGKWGHLRPTMF